MSDAGTLCEASLSERGAGRKMVSALTAWRVSLVVKPRFSIYVCEKGKKPIHRTVVP